MPISTARTLKGPRRFIRRAAHRTQSPRLQFLRGFLKHPVMVGSIIPSSRIVIEKMLAPVDWDNTKLFVEYGPGVGTFTRPILEKLARDATLLTIDTIRDARPPGKTESPAAVRASLRDRLTELIRSDLGPQFLDPRRQKAAPRFPYPPESAPVAERQFAWVGNQLAESERILFDGPGGCAYCHTVKEPAASRADRLPVLSPSNIRPRWWDHAKFKHDTHRMLNCEECHKARDSTKTADILLPGIDLCAKCHDAKASHATARSDCVECHGYHDPALQKKGRAKGTLTLEDVLRK